jgi:hypothetical protein
MTATCALRVLSATAGPALLCSNNTKADPGLGQRKRSTSRLPTMYVLDRLRQIRNVLAGHLVYTGGCGQRSF